MLDAEVVAVMRDCHRPENPGTGAGSGAHSRRAGGRGQDPLPRHHDQTAYALNAVIGFSEMIVQEDVLMVDAARRKEYAQLITNQSASAVVVNGILDMSKEWHI